MNWLLFILRFVFGTSATEPSDSPRVAIRPDGTTVVLPSEVVVRRQQVWRWDWLLPHSFGRDPSVRAHSVVDDFEHGFTQKTSGGGARRRSVDDYRRDDYRRDDCRKDEYRRR